LREPLLVTNKSKLPLRIEVDCQPLFSISLSSHTLSPDDEWLFDLSFTRDFVSECVQARLALACAAHPRLFFGLCPAHPLSCEVHSSLRIIVGRFGCR
jgi:hypothetical protein